MKRLLVTGTVLVILAAGLAAATLWLLRPQPAQTQIIKVAKKAPATVITEKPTYHLGDTQGGITLTHVYIPATPTLPSGILPQFMVVAFELSGVQIDSSSKLALIYTSSSGYIQPHGETVTDCSNCVAFIVPRDATINSFIYKDYTWLL